LRRPWNGSSINHSAVLFGPEHCLHVLSLRLVVSGNAVYNDVYLQLRESSAASRQEWIAALDTIESLHPEVVIVGHKSTAATTRSPLSTTPNETLDLMLATNVRGMFLSMKHELRLMTAQESGVIVNISSGAGLVGVRGYSGYVASKHAEIGPTKSTALDYAHLRIRVNALCPGLVNAPLIAEMINDNPELHEELTAAHPLGRIAEPEEIADAIVWLASE
jgi:NAD(P)-dependent dehydrogenase (short-subunit alcohol dehydrogenase family)